MNIKQNIQNILDRNFTRGDNAKALNELLDLFSVSVSLPHESEIETALDKLLIIRGEHPTRVRNPIYKEERELAKDLVKYILLSNER